MGNLFTKKQIEISNVQELHDRDILRKTITVDFSHLEEFYDDNVNVADADVLDVDV